MKITRIAALLIILFVSSIALLVNLQIRREKHHGMQSALSKGRHLVSLIALYPLMETDDQNRGFFLRTLVEYSANEGFAYLFIHNHSGNAIVSYSPESIKGRIPKDIRLRSLFSRSLINQTFSPEGSDDQYIEFARPIYNGSEPYGTIRLGLVMNPPQIISPQRISFGSMIAFFIMSALIIGYYGIWRSLKPLAEMSQKFNLYFDQVSQDDESEAKANTINAVIKKIENSWSNVKGQIDQFEQRRVQLATEMGVLAFEKDQLVGIIDSVPMGLIIIDNQDNVLHINHYMLSLLGAQREEVLDCRLDDVEGCGQLTGLISDLEPFQGAISEKRLELSFPDILPHDTFEATLSELTDRESVLVGKIVIIKNITSEKNTESSLHDFIAHISHELLTPITNIKSYSEMLMDGEVEDLETQRQFYNTINEETDRLSGLIKNILNLSKIEAGTLMIDSGFVRTDWFLDDCLATIEGSAKEKNIVIEKVLPDNLPTMVADKDLLKAAAINILGNAVKYTPDEGKITVSIFEENDLVVFEIADTGHGITEKDLEHIFEKFYRSEDDRITDQTGSGLGLAITKNIIEMHNGQIDVASEIGKGSQFRISIPKGEYQLG